MENNVTGVQTSGDEFNWSYLNESRVYDPIMNTLMKEVNSLFILNEKIDIDDMYNKNSFQLYLTSFNNYLKEYKYKYTFTIPKIVEEKSKNSKKKVVSKKEQIIQNNKDDIVKKNIKEFITSLKINNQHVPDSTNNKFSNFFSIILWSLYLIMNKKKDIHPSIYLNCSISLYRALFDFNDYFDPIFNNEVFEYLNKLQEIIYSKIINNEIYTFIIKNQNLLLQSLWDKIKPKAISLYEEQKDIISLIINNLEKKLLIFFEMPPANGKTQISALIAKAIANRNKYNLEKINGYKRKTMLYICYNTIVRNELAKLCITQGIDVKYWLAIHQYDKQTNKRITLLRPYKNCYMDWNQRKLRTKREEELYNFNKKKKYSDNIRDQWEFSLEETLRISQQHFTKDENAEPYRDYENVENMPEMIISDLESAYILLKEFPDTFITYFDEAFASSGEEITSKIMSVMGFSVLVSATLANPTEIPNVISHFKNRHLHNNDDFLHVIKSNKQHISCTFVDCNGNIFAPHQIIDNINELDQFILKLDVPLIKRGYSPEVVLDFVSKINEDLPDDLKFRNKFKYFGEITHESIRDYACDIIKYISKSKNNKLFDILKSNIVNKIPNMDIYTIFTTSAVNYQYCNTLHVSNLENFDKHVDNISNPLLDGSPKMKNIINEYDRQFNSISDQIKSYEKSKTDDTDELISELNKNLNNLKIVLPSEFIMNSRSHSSKFGNSRLLTRENIMNNMNKEKAEILDETRTKLLFSNIGVYQPEDFSNNKMDLFLRNKDQFRFILSTPAIVYGTNISISIIDIDNTFINYSTKNILYQLIGRAGRRGKSESATIIFRNNDMLNIIFKTELSNIEAENIERNFLNFN